MYSMEKAQKVFFESSENTREFFSVSHELYALFHPIQHVRPRFTRRRSSTHGSRPHGLCAAGICHCANFSNHTNSHPSCRRVAFFLIPSCELGRRYARASTSAISILGPLVATISHTTLFLLKKQFKTTSEEYSEGCFIG